MKLSSLPLILTISAFACFPSTAQDVVDDAFVMETRKLVAVMDAAYQNGGITDPEKIQEYIEFMDFLGRYDDALSVLTREMETGRLERTADNIAKAAYYLRRLEREEEAVPLLREAVDLGDKDSQIQLVATLIRIQKNSDSHRDCQLIERESEQAVQSGWPEVKAEIDISKRFLKKIPERSPESETANKWLKVYKDRKLLVGALCQFEVSESSR